MLFEYDPDKSLSNKTKHGIDFEAAQAIWGDLNIATLRGHLADEVRWMAIGKIRDKVGAVVYVRRGDRIRLISAQRARRKEVQIYERGRI